MAREAFQGASGFVSSRARRWKARRLDRVYWLGLAQLQDETALNRVSWPMLQLSNAERWLAREAWMLELVVDVFTLDAWRALSEVERRRVVSQFRRCNPLRGRSGAVRAPRFAACPGRAR